MFAWIKTIYRHGPILTFDHFDVKMNQETVESYPKVSLEWVKDPMIKDQYQIHVYHDYTLRIRYGNQRSKAFALQALASLEFPISVGIYEGGPDVEIRGIIEGFYGTPWSHEDRLDVISTIREYRMNSYFYAPKDDPYHRELWRVPYPAMEFGRITELVRKSQREHVDFYFCISPGKDFVYTRDDEFDVLFMKLNQLIDMGVSTFALLMDDIDYKLEGDSLSRFERPGMAHAYISNRMYDHLKSRLDHPVMVMCPTEYAQNVDSVYRKDLSLSMHPEIMVFWTGYNTVAEFIPNLDGIRAQAYFRHPLILWDNYPVNDMAKDRLFMGPIRNRGKQLASTHVGMVSNPMVEWHLSKPAILTMAMYMWDVSGYDPDQAYDAMIEWLSDGKRDIVKHLSAFIDEHYDSLIFERPNPMMAWIENLEFDKIGSYYRQLTDAVDALEAKPFDQRWILQAKPWFDRIRQDAALFDKMRHGKATRDDLSDVLQSKHATGRQMILHLAIRLQLLLPDHMPKKRMVFWELKAPQL